MNFQGYLFLLILIQFQFLKLKEKYFWDFFYIFIKLYITYFYLPILSNIFGITCAVSLIWGSCKTFVNKASENHTTYSREFTIFSTFWKPHYIIAGIVPVETALAGDPLVALIFSKQKKQNRFLKCCELSPSELFLFIFQEENAFQNSNPGASMSQSIETVSKK